MNAETLDALLAPPDDAAVKRAMGEFATKVRAVYGDRLKGLYLFGSRARGDHTPESDADVAVVLVDGSWQVWPETKRLTDLAYDILMTTGAEVEGWPVSQSEWSDPSRHENPSLVRAMRAEARPL